MRNLGIAEINATSLEADDLPLTSTTFDASTGDVIYTLGPDAARPVIELRRRSADPGSAQNQILITSWDAPCPLPDLECDQVLSLHYFHESSSVCIALAGGDLVLVRERPSPDQERIEIVGSLDVGITAAEWSWDASLLALVTRTGSLVLMSQQLEPLSETPFKEDDLSMSKHVSVGWGKKETQFQGKRAKALKDPTMPDLVDEGKPSVYEDGKTVISWRGDSGYVAVNSTFASSRRVIRVYSAVGQLDSVSEPVDGLESALSWRPYGNAIASIRRTSNALEVLFFERNGLRHGQFDLRLNADEASSFGVQTTLCWNCDSSILAVKFLDRAYLWTMDNYHYYLKQDIRLDGVQDIKWHNTDPLCLSLSGPGLLQAVTLDRKILRGSLCPPFDYGMVAVIDGKVLKLTPFKHVNIPPPMAYIEVAADDNIISCAISRTCQRIAYVTHSHIYLCKLEMIQTRKKTKDSPIRHSNKVQVNRLRLPSLETHGMQIVIQDDDKIFLLVRAPGSSGGVAACYQSIWVTTIHGQDQLRLTERPLGRGTKQLVTDIKQEALYSRESGHILSVPEGTLDIPVAASTHCDIFHIHRDGVVESYAVSLSNSQRLVIRGQESGLKIDNVSSFAVTDDHVVFTTSNHLIKFIHLADPSSMVVPEDTPEIDERCRAVERGSMIVTIIPSIYAVVLQMPRGNLEIIYPRIMVLAGVRSHLRSRDYLKAYLACQTHQVDLNILHDYDPESFFASIPLFFDQLKKPSRIDEFIQKLREEDVTKTLYRDTSVTDGTASKGTPPQTNTHKVNEICDSLISELQARPAIYQPNIITAYVCKKPPDLVSALVLVSNLRRSSTEEADLAVAHLCFLTDTNRLFDTALSLYDLDLTLLVAQNAQRDPREYMPFLQSLQALPTLRRQYVIDNHLKKYSKALGSLNEMTEYAEMEAYTVKHDLYIDAIDLLKNSPGQRDRVKRLYADHLSDLSKHAQAAILYESLSDFDSAYPLYALAHQWREALTCACLASVSKTQLEALARSLATTCAEESRDYRSAATIHMDYMEDALGAAELLCKGSYFAEATRILSHPEHAQLQGFVPAEQLAQIVDLALTRKFGEILELVADCQTQLKSQVPRIEELRVKKAEDPFAFFGGEVGVSDGVDVPDNISLAPTNASTLGGQSMFTRYGGGAGGSQVSTKFGGTVRSDASRKTSKTKRKEERKRAQGKKGSVYEEEYLVASCGRLIERVNGVHEEVRRLVSGLSRRGFSEQAKKVEEVMESIQAGCEDAVARVWKLAKQANTTKAVNGAGSGDGNGQLRPNGADAVLFDSQHAMEDRSRERVPEVKAWKNSII